MQTTAQDHGQPQLPWAERASWQELLATGLACAAVWSAIAFNPAAGTAAVDRFVLAATVLAVSVGQIVAGVRSRQRPAALWLGLAGGVGAIASLPALLANWLTASDHDGAWQILALGLVLFAILSLGALVVADDQSGGERIAFMVSLVLLPVVVGVVLLRGLPPEALESSKRVAYGLFASGLISLWNALRRWRRSSKHRNETSP